MRANSAKREPEIQQFWEDKQIYQRLSQNNPGDIFVLHDGPPYANGALHIGHALNKILKDIINRYQLLQGRKVRYIPGWDCHGLPIELKVLQQMKSSERSQLTPLTLRQKARDFALKTVEEQKQGFQRYGVWGDWENPYLTLKPAYEAAQIGVFGQMVLKGYIYRGKKPVHWSPSSKTALAEAELEYPDNHISRSIYAAFAVTELNAEVKEQLSPYLPNLGVAIWTTTPWTIPGNLAVSVNPELKYAVVEVGGKKNQQSQDTGGKGFGETSPSESDQNAPRSSSGTLKFQYLIVAAELVERLSQVMGRQLTVKETLTGRQLEYCSYQHPVFERTSPIVIGGDYVTTESGTGLVHTAPGHGLEDFQVGQRYGLPLLSPVDEHGNFTEQAGEFAGTNVLGDGNRGVIDALQERGVLLHEEDYNHKYPYDWRTKKPTIFRATEQWFASVDGFREAVLQAIEQVQWIPVQGKNRIQSMVAERSDWCISRQRSWGVPIPVFYDEASGEPLLTEETIAHVQNIFAERGSDAWWELPVEELLPESYRNNGRTYRKGTDTMDVWFDSGSSWAAVAAQREELTYPVDMYLEGSDQHRGWFQSSLLTSVANNGISPYKTVLTHGFVLDEKGRKMSKSLGNVIDPQVVIAGGNNQKQDPPYGADVLRLWVSSVDYSSDVPLGKNILKQLADVYRKIRNTARFLLGNLHDFDPSQHAVAYEEMPELDRYMLHRMSEVFAEVTTAFSNYQFFRFFQMVQNFCVVDLSNFYLDVVKDRLYISAADSWRRRSCQTVMAIAVENLARSIAPVMCHMAEDIWQNLPYPTTAESVFESGWVYTEPHWNQPELADRWQKLRQIRMEVNKVLETARSEKKIGASLDAKALLYVSDPQLCQAVEELHQVAATSPQPEPNPQPSPAKVSQEMTVDDVKFPETFPKSREEWDAFFAALNTAWQVWSPVVTKGATLAAVVLSAGIVLKVTASILNAIATVPGLPAIFQLIGLGYSGVFVVRNLLFSRDRQALQQKIQTTKQQIVGEPATTETATSLPQQPAKPQTNGVDELRYLFLVSQVEMVSSPEAIQQLDYRSETDKLAVGITEADGQKCDRCWNYSTQVGFSQEHPTICERCVAALDGKF
jgi:isoleucyl-tRNA synthetase